MFNRFLKRLTGRSEDDLTELSRAVRRLTDAQRDHAAAVASRLGSLSDLVAQRATARDANEILRSLRAATLLSGGSGDDPGDDARLYQALDAVAKGTRPIVVGPWTGEVGFELLYWIPFVEWFRDRWRIDAGRLVVVSRGGTEAWYGMTGARYVDIFSLMAPDEFRARTDPHAHKQRELSALDRAIVDAASGRLGLDDPALLHPRLLYRRFAPYWRDEAGYSLIERFTRPRKITPADDPVTAELPADYVAVRFYFSDGFPDTPANREFATRITASIAERTTVVLLNPGVSVDDHADTAPPASARVIGIADRLTPERNLAAQSAVIARARAFVGTYGGYAYLAPLCGVPAVSFFSEREFKLHHLTAAQRMFAELGTATLVAVDVRDAEAAGLALRGAGGRG